MFFAVLAVTPIPLRLQRQSFFTNFGKPPETLIPLGIQRFRRFQCSTGMFHGKSGPFLGTHQIIFIENALFFDFANLHIIRQLAPREILSAYI